MFASLRGFVSQCKSLLAAAIAEDSDKVAPPSWEESCGFHLEKPVSQAFPTSAGVEGDTAHIAFMDSIQGVEGGGAYNDPFHWLPMTRWQNTNDLHSTGEGGITGFVSSLGDAGISLITTWLFSLASFLWGITIWLVKVMVEAPTLAARFIGFIGARFHQYATAVKDSGFVPLLMAIAVFVGLWMIIKSGDLRTASKRVAATFIPLLFVYVLSDLSVAYTPLPGTDVEETADLPPGSDGNLREQPSVASPHFSVWMFARTLELSSLLSTPVILLSDALAKDVRTPDQLTTCDAYTAVLEAQFLRAWNTRGDHNELTEIARASDETLSLAPRADIQALQTWAQTSNRLRLRTALLVSRIWENSYAVGFGQVQFGNSVAADRAFCLYADWRSRRITPTEQLAVWRATCLLPRVSSETLPNAKHLSLAGCDYFPSISSKQGTFDVREVEIQSEGDGAINIPMSPDAAANVCSFTDSSRANSFWATSFGNGFKTATGDQSLQPFHDNYAFGSQVGLTTELNDLQGKGLVEPAGLIRFNGTTNVEHVANGGKAISDNCARVLWAFNQIAPISKADADAGRGGFDFASIGEAWAEVSQTSRRTHRAYPFTTNTDDTFGGYFNNGSNRSFIGWLVAGIKGNPPPQFDDIRVVVSGTRAGREIPEAETERVLQVKRTRDADVYASAIFTPSPVRGGDGSGDRFGTRTMLAAQAVCDYTAWRPSDILPEERQRFTAGAPPTYSEHPLEISGSAAVFDSYIEVASPRSGGTINKYGTHALPRGTNQVVKIDRNVLGLGEGGNDDQRASAKPCFTYLFGTGDNDGFGDNDNPPVGFSENTPITAALPADAHFGVDPMTNGGSGWLDYGTRGYPTYAPGTEKPDGFPGAGNKYALDRLGRTPEQYFFSSLSLPIQASPVDAPPEASFIPTANTAANGADIYAAIHGRQPAKSITLGLASLLVAIAYLMALSGLALGSALSVVLLAIIIGTLPLTLLLMAVPIDATKELPKKVFKLWFGAMISYSVFLLAVTFVLLIIELIVQGTRQIGVDSSNFWYSILLGIAPLIAIKVVSVGSKQFGADISKPSGAFALTSGTAFAQMESGDPLKQGRQYARKGMQYLRSPRGYGGRGRRGATGFAAAGGGPRVTPNLTPAAVGGGGGGGIGAGLALAGGGAALATTLGGGGGGGRLAGAAARLGGGGRGSRGGVLPSIGSGGGGEAQSGGFLSRLGQRIDPTQQNTGMMSQVAQKTKRAFGAVRRHPAAFGAAAAVLPFGLMPAALGYGAVKLANRTIGNRMRMRMGMYPKRGGSGDLAAVWQSIHTARTKLGQTLQQHSGAAQAPNNPEGTDGATMVQRNPHLCNAPTLAGHYCQRALEMCQEPTHLPFQADTQQYRPDSGASPS